MGSSPPSLFDHISLGVSNLEASASVYAAALEALGLVVSWRTDRAMGFGPPGFDGEAPFALVVPKSGGVPSCDATHFAFRAVDRASVDAFHAAAIANGAVCDGPPGVREAYGPGYYAAFVIDPDGHRLEAVVHEEVAG